MFLSNNNFFQTSMIEYNYVCQVLVKYNNVVRRALGKGRPKGRPQCRRGAGV